MHRIETRGRVRWGIIGCGDVTEVKSGPAFDRVPDSRLNVVMRRDAARARDYAERHGVPRWTTDADEVILADDVDAVYVATPPSSHAGFVARVAAAGKPVYVEKPMARDAAEARAMVDACAAAGVPLFVAYYRRALPRFETVRRWLSEGRIGAPTMVDAVLHLPAPAGPAEAGWRWDPAVGGEGLLLDVGSHGLDLLDHWLGPVADTAGFAGTRQDWARVADEVVAALRFSGGVRGVAAWGFSGAVRRDRITIVGREGLLSVPLLAEGPVRHVGADGAVEEHVIPHPAHVQEPLIASIVAELLGRGGPCRSRGESALRTQLVLDALLAGGEPSGAAAS